MKKLLSLLAAAALFASCSRTGSTIASDDSVIGEQLRQSAQNEKMTGGYPLPEKSLPQPVREAFQQRYPGASNTAWCLLADGTYKAMFFTGKIKWTSIYAADGTLLHEEHS